MENNEAHKKIAGIYIPPELHLNPALTLTEMCLFDLIKSLCTSGKGCWATNHYLSTRLFFCSEQTITNSLSKLKHHQYIIIKYEQTQETGNKKSELERHIFINPDYQTLYLPLITIHTKNIDILSKEEIKTLLLSTYNKIMDTIKNFYEGGHKNFYDIYNNINKEDTKEYNNKDTNVSLPVGNGQAFSDKSDDKGKSYKVDMTAYSPDVQNLYDLWRNLGSPIKQHRNGSKTNYDAICALKKAVKLHDPDKIANAMLLYHKIISSAQDYKLSMRAPGHLIGLNEFFRFSDFTRSRIDKKNCAYDIQSWFDECIKGEIYVDRIYAKHKVENTDPEITTQLKKYWKTYISKEVPQSPGDEDCFRLAATKFRKFIKKNRNNVALHDNIDINNLPRDSKYLYEAIIEKTDNLKIVTPAWLCSDVMFKKRFPSYLYHQGMMDNDFDDDDDDQSDFVNQLHEMYGG